MSWSSDRGKVQKETAVCADLKHAGPVLNVCFAGTLIYLKTRSKMAST
jgi:hypothetical protein